MPRLGCFRVLSFAGALFALLTSVVVALPHLKLQPALATRCHAAMAPKKKPAQVKARLCSIAAREPSRDRTELGLSQLLLWDAGPSLSWQAKAKKVVTKASVCEAGQLAVPHPTVRQAAVKRKPAASKASKARKAPSGDFKGTRLSS